MNAIAAAHEEGVVAAVAAGALDILADLDKTVGEPDVDVFGARAGRDAVGIHLGLQVTILVLQGLDGGPVDEVG